MTLVTGAVALVTGASSGIGRSVAVDLAKAGATPVLVARSKERLEQVLAEVERYHRALIWTADVRDPHALQALVRTVIDRLGRIDILVNNAGVGRYLSLLEHTGEDIEEMFNTNVFAAIRLTRLVLPHMLKSKSGHIVNVSSIAGRIGSPYHTVYCASKFALAGFTESLGFELEGTGVRLTLVNPGIVDTGFFSHPSFQRYPRAARERMISPDRVSRVIIKAIRKGKREVTVPRSYAAGIVVKALCPKLFRAIMGLALREA